MIMYTSLIADVPTEVKVLGIVVVGAALVFGLMKKKRSKTSTKVIKPFPVELPLSGSASGLGGMLIDAQHLMHVTHWPDVTGQEVWFTGEDGTRVSRTVVEKIVLAEKQGPDLCLLKLDEPLDPTNHKILEIDKARVDDKLTILRLDRLPFGTYVKQVKGGIISARSGGANSEIRSGDSGKAWLVQRSGNIRIVSLTSKGYNGEGPDLHHFKQSMLDVINGV